MKRNITKIFAALALLVFTMPSLVAWGQTRTEITWTASEQGYSNQQEITSVAFDSNVSAVFNKGTNSNAPKYYTSGTAIRCYGGNYFTISTTSGNLTSIAITFGNSDGSNAITTDVGTYSNGTWSGTASSVKFTIGGTSGNRRIAGFTIKYSTGGNPNAATPTFSPAGGTYAQAKNVAINCATENATIYYTTNGDDPTTSSDVYSSPITISETTTLKAMAAATGYSNSAVASATYTITTPSTIAEVRAQGSGDVFTQGIVTSCVGTTGYIQDNTAAICVYGTSLAIGDAISVSGTLTTYSGLLEITNPVVDVISSGNTINPELMTIAQVNASDNQGWYVRIEEATVTAISGSGNSQNTTIAQGDNTIVVYGNLGVTVAVNDVVSLNGNIGNHNAVQIANPQNVEVQANTDPVINVTNSSIELAYNATSGEIEYNISNPVTGTSLNANTDADWISNINVGASSVTFTTAVNESNDERSATITLSYTGAQNVVVTVTQAPFVIDYAVLPFQYAGGVLNDFLALVGTSHSLNDQGSYAEGNAPYRIKFTKTGDYLQVKTDSQPGIVTIGVKMLGGANTSKITVQGSADGVTFTDIQELTISGNQNDILTLETTNAFASTDRYVRLLFTKGSNVGVGPITIAKVSNDPIIVLENNTVELAYDASSGSFNYSITNPVGGVNLQATTEADWISNITVGASTVTFTTTENEGEEDRSATITLSYTGASNKTVTVTQGHFTQEYTLTISNPDHVTITAGYGTNGVLTNGDNASITNGTEVTVTLNIEEGYVLDEIVVVGENNQTATVSPTATAGVYKFNMPAFNATLNVTAVTVPASVYTLATSITSGKQYIIVGWSNSVPYAMGNDKGNNRYAYSITIDGTTASASIANNGVHEFTISTITEGYYSIMDATTNGGYLYAAGSGSGKNYLKTEAELDENDNGKWAITFAADGTVSVIAQGSNTNNQMRFNNNNELFSCYSTGQHPVYLYEKVETPVTETYTLTINGYTDVTEGINNKGYYLIASPVTVDPAEVDGMTEDDFDLYYFKQNPEIDPETGIGLEWINYKETAANGGGFNLVPGKGYLYAKKATNENPTYSFELTGMPYTGDGSIELVKDTESQWAGWNLIGNPFGVTANFSVTRDFYVMNTNGNEIIAAEDPDIAPMQGVFVIAEEDGESVTFVEAVATPGIDDKKVVLNVSRNRGDVIDRAIVRFGEGRQLPKFQLNQNNAKVYIAEGNQDYAVVRSAYEGEMPVSFKAESNGTYTISANAENVEMTYLHLIDNLTGADVDLLATPSYTFDARTTDYASRFKLVFKAGTGIDENTTTATFAFFNGSEWTVSNQGNATLQVIDMTGRVLSNTQINGNATININETAGIYMLRLVNGDNTMIQKIVVR